MEKICTRRTIYMLRIEYLRDGERVMVALYTKPREEAWDDAMKGLVRYEAHVAHIVDSDGKIVGTVAR